MPPLAGADGFRLDPDADLHRCAAGIIDRRAKGDEFADMDRLAEDDLIDRQGHGIFLREARGAGKGDPIKKIEQRAAMHLAAEIGHVGRHQHDHLEPARVMTSFQNVTPSSPFSKSVVIIHNHS